MSMEWEYKRSDQDDLTFRRCNFVPSLIHLELLKNGEFQDPFLGLNERDIQAVAQYDWTYRYTYDLPSIQSDTVSTIQEMVFDGLDTFVKVSLNGHTILTSNNAFHSHRVDVARFLKPTKNILLLNFFSPLRRGTTDFLEHGGGVVWNGDPSRLYVRKPQYQYGWDWGPALLSCGPYKRIFTEYCRHRISDVKIIVIVNANLSTRIDFEISVFPVNYKGHCTIDLSIEGTTIGSEQASFEDGKAKPDTFYLGSPQLWYPSGYGAQPLYEVVVRVPDAPVERRKIGLRRVELIQDVNDASSSTSSHPCSSDEESIVSPNGSSFYFRINNIPIFCSGANWIPPDSFMPRVTTEDYRQWLTLLKNSNQIMLRVWGGGIYESSEFYNICDELGIIVWQDAMFACGQYPAHPIFRKSVEKEIVDNITRIRHHPSLVLFCGNNEDYQIAEAYDLDWNKTSHDQDEVLASNFPARYIYEILIPEVLQRIAPELAYWPGSPFGGSSTRDAKSGDIHQWNIWHGTKSPYQSFSTDWDQFGGRFISEFGMHAMPDIKTCEVYLSDSDEGERHPASETNAHHNKAAEGESRMAWYLSENIRYNPNSLEDYIYATQLIQHEAMTHAYKACRRHWDTRRSCGGLLVWQMNDCWPCTSWSICDYYKRPKAAYYAIKREMGPIIFGMQRIRKERLPLLRGKVRGKPGAAQDIESAFYYGPWDYFLDLWGSNLTLREVGGIGIVRVYDIVSGEEVNPKPQLPVISAKLPRNQTIELWRRRAIPAAVAEKCVIEIQFTSLVDGSSIRFYNWPEPLLKVSFPSRMVSIRVQGTFVHVSARKPTKGIVLSVANCDIEWSDNCFDLASNETVKIEARGLRGETVSVRWYGSDNCV